MDFTVNVNLFSLQYNVMIVIDVCYQLRPKAIKIIVLSYRHCVTELLSHTLPLNLNQLNVTSLSNYIYTVARIIVDFEYVTDRH